jgi:hypothetical protein
MASPCTWSPRAILTPSPRNTPRPGTTIGSSSPSKLSSSCGASSRSATARRAWRPTSARSRSVSAMGKSRGPACPCASCYLLAAAAGRAQRVRGRHGPADPSLAAGPVGRAAGGRAVPRVARGG